MNVIEVGTYDKQSIGGCKCLGGLNQGGGNSVESVDSLESY